ncbi:MAG: S8 family peptidase [Firmicutes bacterium]|uniref:S8 family peptidase n=1 Tax=Candidatus Onthovivens merdipullorum TaxID=2840889 RepID=A0A9D9DMT8_9BACL|nr:S8 family peptidase [Candidatus Onthovivens merdipullorum]
MSSKTHYLIKLSHILKKEKPKIRSSTYYFFNNLPLKQSDLQKLLNELIEIRRFFSKIHYLDNECIFEIHFKDVPSKNNRPNQLFNFYNVSIDKYIIGAKFTNEENISQIFTFNLPLSILEKVIDRFNLIDDVFNKLNLIEISSKEVLEKEEKIRELLKDLSFSKFKIILNELSHINKFAIPHFNEKVEEFNLVNFYETKTPLLDIFKMNNLEISKNNIYKNIARLTKEEFNKVIDKFPFLISMSVNNIIDEKIEESDLINDNTKFELIKKKLPKPTNKEPIIGVIDSLFDETSYVNEYVENHNYIEYKSKILDDYLHGSEVTSLIVDLPSLNPSLDDGCGRFRVRHFGVCYAKQKIDAFLLYKQIEEIVSKNLDINVWNLSLGSTKEIKKNTISPIANLLDKLQYKYKNIIFVVSGTNRGENNLESIYIGTPADSINSLVVNSVKKNNEVATYSRRGPVLSFFIKPDVSYYGGDIGEELFAGINSLIKVKGTSFVAPLISRKLAYLINVLGLSRDLAKTLIIDSAVFNPNYKNKNINYIGRGIVPIKIKDIIETPKDEIKVLIDETSSSYISSTYEFPIPIDKFNNKFNYYAHLTMTSNIKTLGSNGVNYSKDDINIQFGPIDNVTNNIVNIDKNYLADNKNSTNKKEYNLRKEIRKFDNVKILGKEYTTKAKGRSLKNRKIAWGLKITHIDNSFTKDSIVNYGIVIHLKELDGRDRYDEFLTLCEANLWHPEVIDITQKIEFNNSLYEEINLEN